MVMHVLPLSLVRVSTFLNFFLLDSQDDFRNFRMKICIDFYVTQNI